MTTYLAEWYVPVGEHEDFPLLARQVAAAVEDMTSDRIPLRYLGAALSMTDETAFCLLESPSEESLGKVAHRAGLRFDRITEALYVPENG
jgi:Nickel responsive protein SCO4226-like